MHADVAPAWRVAGQHAGAKQAELKGQVLLGQVIGETEGALEGWKEAGRWQEKGILEQVARKEHKWAY